MDDQNFPQCLQLHTVESITKSHISWEAQEQDKVVLRRKCKFSQSKSHSIRELVFLSKSKFNLSRQVQLQNTQERERKHISHRHPLRPYKVPEKDEIICSGCELELSGSAYGCTKCNFFLHKSCIELPRQIRHKSHPHHTLTLLSSSPYKGIGTGTFICNACDDHGNAFDYHCATCNYDLHVDCAYLPKTVDCDHHEHPLTLYYSIPYSVKDGYVLCDVCNLRLIRNRWCYYCVDCDYGTHLECVTDEAEENSEYQLTATQNQFQNFQL